MKKTIFILSLLLVSGATVQAQQDTLKPKQEEDKRAKRQNGINAVYNIPVGDFGGVDGGEGGYADKGWGIGFEKKTYFLKGLYFVSRSSYSWIPLNTEELSKDLEEATGLYNEIDGGQHRPMIGTFGLGLDFKPLQLFSVSVNAQGGILHNSFKPFDIKIYDNGPGSTVLVSDVYKFDSDWAFGYSFGLDAQLFIIPNTLSIYASANYTAAKIDSYLRSHYSEPEKSVSKMELININFGIAFHGNH